MKISQFVPVLLVLSTNSMLLLDQRTLQIKYRIPASEIYRMSLSPYLDDIAVFHVKAVSFNFDSIFDFERIKFVRRKNHGAHILYI